MPSKAKVGTTGDQTRHSLICDYVEGGSTTPEFYRKKNSRIELPVNAYTWKNIRFMSSLAIQCNPGFQQNAYFGWYSPTDMLQGSGPGGPWPAINIKSDTLARYRRKVQNQLFTKMLDANMDSIAFVVELPQTVRLLADAFNSIVGAFQALVHRQPRKFVDMVLWGKPMRQRTASGILRADPTTKKHAEGLADRWLQTSFGLKPLLADAETAASAFTSFHNETDRQIQTETTGVSINEPFTQFFKWVTDFQSRSGNITGRMKAQAVYVVDSPWDVLYQQLGLDSPASSAWECIPFSFVLDWFIPVKNWLQTGRSIEGCHLVRSWSSERYEAWSVNVKRYCGGQVTGTEKHLEKRRFSVGMPVFWDLTPWDPQFSVKRLADAIALGVQNFLSK